MITFISIVYVVLCGLCIVEIYNRTFTSGNNTATLLDINALHNEALLYNELIDSKRSHLIPIFDKRRFITI